MLLKKAKPGSSKSKPSEKRKAEPQTPQTPDPQEDEFWNTPGAARTLHFTGELLTDEQLDLADLSGSLASPVPEMRRRPPGASRALEFKAAEPNASVHEPEQEDDATSESPEPPDVVDEDKTVMLPRPTAVAASVSLQSSPDPQSTPAPVPAPTRPSKTKVTTELEHIVVSSVTVAVRALI